MQLVFTEQELPATFNPGRRMTDDEYYDFCMANPDLHLERTAEGEIVIVPPAGGESDFQSTEVIIQLGGWAKTDGRGRTFGMSSMFILPTGAAFSPDAAWVSHERLAKMPKEQRRRFMPVCPQFVVEVMSPSDRIPKAKAKMEEWLRGGVELAWLIDGDASTVYIYRAGRDVEKCTGITTLAGEGSIAGFTLDLTEIWAGL